MQQSLGPNSWPSDPRGGGAEASPGRQSRIVIIVIEDGIGGRGEREGGEEEEAGTAKCPRLTMVHAMPGVHPKTERTRSQETKRMKM
jgi:hypothetical protein